MLSRLLEAVEIERGRSTATLTELLLDAEIIHPDEVFLLPGEDVLIRSQMERIGQAYVQGLWFSEPATPVAKLVRWDDAS